MSGERREERHIATLVHGRYLVEAPADPTGCPLLVGFHGYGETADKSMEEMRKIPGAAQWVLCAVQALHPFYNRTGEVIASWMTRLMLTEDACTGPINLGNDSEFTMLQLAEKVISVTGSSSKLVFKPLPQDDPRQRQPDLSRAKSLLNWEPEVTLDDGLKETIAYFKRTLEL